MLPTPEAVEDYLAAPAEDAHQQLVERTADIAPIRRTLGSTGWTRSITRTAMVLSMTVYRPHAWRYRDYLIDSLNADKPWDRMIREQLAADALFPDRQDLIPALGFLGAGTYDHSAAATAPKSFENLDRDDMVTQTMASFVSTTANCARCHAHKFDPVTQEDYYALQAVFAGIGKAYQV